MEYLDPKQKRAHKNKLFVGYALMVAIIVIGTWLIAYVSSGFYYDAKTKQVIQNGLLFVDTHPVSARVSLNGSDKGETDVRLVLPSGDYKVVLTREGYRNWEHDLSLGARTVERLIYPFLFPVDLVSSDVDLFSVKPNLATQSPDRRWLIMKRPGELNQFEVVDLNSDSAEPTIVTLDPAVLQQTGTKHVFKEIEWSTDNKHVLLSHEYEGGKEFVLLDRENGSAAVNINKTFNRPITDVRLRDKKFDKYYLHDTKTGTLVSALLSDTSVATVASNVLDYQPHGNDLLLYATDKTTDKDIAEVKIADKDQHYTIREIPRSSAYLLDLAEFKGKWYVALGASTDQRVYIYTNPLDDLKRENQRTPLASAQLRLNKPIEHMSFSANTRFIAIQAGSSFAVYDAETVRQFRYDVDLALPEKYQAKWMDGHRLNAVSDGKVVVFDFDGTNKQSLVAAYGEFYPFFDRDYNKLFTISPSMTVKDKSALVLTPMRYDPEAQN